MRETEKLQGIFSLPQQWYIQHRKEWRIESSFICIETVLSVFWAVTETDACLGRLSTVTCIEAELIDQLVKKIPGVKRTRRFITVLTRARHLILFWASLIQSTPSHRISLRAILILSSHLRVWLPDVLFPSGFPNTIFYTFLISARAYYMPRSSHPPLFNRSDSICLRVTIMKLLFMCFSQFCFVLYLA
jgi:hypothetical protein